MEWPVEAIFAVVGLSITTMAACTKVFIQWRQSSEGHSVELHKLGWAEVRFRDQMIEVLRRLLDRGRRRENAYASGVELLLIALPDHLTPEQQRCVLRAQELFEAAVLPAPGEMDGL